MHEDTRRIRPRVTYSDTTRSTLLGLLIEFQEGPAKFLRGSASSRQEGRTTMTFGNLLSASAERNPRRAAIVLEKESISHVLRPHTAPYRNSSATPSPRPATGIKRAPRRAYLATNVGAGHTTRARVSYAL